MHVTSYVHYNQRDRGNKTSDTWHAGFWSLVSGVPEKPLEYICLRPWQFSYVCCGVPYGRLAP